MPAVYKVDLHVHTCLSPCGGSRMIPPAIVEAALRRGMSAIAVTDHNAAGNIESVMEAARGTGLVVLGGMEITSEEEIHLVSIFSGLREALEAERIVHEHLRGENDAERFGDQWLVDAEGYITGTSNKLLAGATDLDIDKLIVVVHGLGGLAIAAHVDRPAYSVTSQLGFVPDDLNADALEVMGTTPAAAAGVGSGRWPLLSSSDAHVPEEVGTKYAELTAEAPTFEELVLTLRGAGGKRIRPMTRE